MSECVKDLFKKTGVRPSEIDILVINCSLFSPTPSLCAVVINEFNLRPDIMSYNLSGMVTSDWSDLTCLYLYTFSGGRRRMLTSMVQGCSAGVISLELASSVLSSHPNSLALVISTENLTQALYTGNDRGFLVQNTLFRCGGCDRHASLTCIGNRFCWL